MSNANHVLIVDDDPGQRSLFESFLNGEGYRTVTAASGGEALELADRMNPPLILSDVRMPGMSGLELQQELRRRGVTVPILLLTAYADIRDAVDAIQEGDEVDLFAGDTLYKFIVEQKLIVREKGESLEVRQRNAQWIAPTNDVRLTLVTCWPYTNNTHRVIVVAKPSP